MVCDKAGVTYRPRDFSRRHLLSGTLLGTPPCQPGAPHPHSLGAAGDSAGRRVAHSTQHLQKAGPGKRGPQPRGGQGTIQMEQLTMACLSNAVNLKLLTLNIQVINSTSQASTPTRQGNTY